MLSKIVKINLSRETNWTGGQSNYLTRKLHLSEPRLVMPW